MGLLQTTVINIHPHAEPSQLTGRDHEIIDCSMYVEYYYKWLIFNGLVFSIPPVRFGQPIFMQFWQYFVRICLVSWAVMYHMAVFLKIGWYCVVWIVLFCSVLFLWISLFELCYQRWILYFFWINLYMYIVLVLYQPYSIVMKWFVHC